MGNTNNESSVEVIDSLSKNKTGTNKFEHMLSDYEYERPSKGQFLEGEVVRIEDEAIFIDVGTKRDALVSRKDINNLDGELLAELKRGDQLPVYVIQAPGGEDELLVSISKGLEQEDWDRAENYLTTGETLVLEAVGVNRGGLIVDFGRITGFVPNSHIPEIKNIKSREQVGVRKMDKIGTRLPLNVIEVDRERNRLILSGKVAQREVRFHRLQELKRGDIVKGRVVNIVNFGAFIDLHGITGLAHISELSWHRLGHPSEIISIGDEIEVLIKEVDHDKERVSLSRKALMPNPWDSIMESHNEGDLVEGSVTSIQDYGVFLKLAEGVDGLIHVSEIDGNPEEKLTIGQRVLVRIIEIDPRRERISLSHTRVTEEERLSWLM